MNKTGIQSLLAELQAEYLQAFPAKIIAMRSLVQNQKWTLLETEFHKLKGTGKTYGLPEISLVGEFAEKACLTSNWSIDDGRQAMFSKVLDLLMEVHHARTMEQPLTIEGHPIFQRLLLCSQKAA